MEKIMGNVKFEKIHEEKYSVISGGPYQNGEIFVNPDESDEWRFYGGEFGYYTADELRAIADKLDSLSPVVGEGRTGK